MIKKLERKISFIIILSLSIITIGVTCIYTISNYRNTIETSVNFMNRIFGTPPQQDNFQTNTQTNQMNSKKENNEIINSIEANQETDFPQIDGIYKILVSNDGTILESNQEIDEELKSVAVQAIKKRYISGTIGNYVYKIEKNNEHDNSNAPMEQGKNDKNNENNISNMFDINNNNVENSLNNENDKKNTPDSATMVMLTYNKDLVTRLHNMIIISIVFVIVIEIIIYIIALKISEWIVKPVENTFNKQKEFISDASHELKTPLAVIEANTEVLENNIGKNKWLTYIQNEIDSMNKLINELLLLAKMENVDSIQNTEKFNLSQEAQIAISMFESMAYEKNVKLETNIEENIMFNGRKEDIEHILSTLIDNAIKHTKTKVEVNLKKERDKIVINVLNEGEEIPQEEREKIFERFYRVDKSRNRNEKRYGLGLAIAKSIVQKYNGEIKVDCKDGITTFTVKLPN